MRPSPRGFSLIELMIVVGVIAILSLMALPSFTDRIARQQVSDALEATDFVRKAVAARYLGNQKFPADNAVAGLPPPDRIVSKFVSQVTVRDGVVELLFAPTADAHLAGKRLTLRPAYVEDYPQVPVVWVCGAATVPEKMVAQGVNQTDVAALYLPLACRETGAKKT